MRKSETLNLPARFLPLSPPAVAVMVALPPDTAVTVPSLVTVATASLLLFHVTALLASAGVSVAVSFSVKR